MVWTSLKAFGVVDKPRLLADTLNSGLGLILSSVDADQLFVIVAVAEFMYVPQQEHFIHWQTDQITAGCGKYTNAELSSLSTLHGAGVAKGLLLSTT